MPIQDQPLPSTLGSLLRNARIEQGLSVDDMAAALKLDPDKIEFMEADQWVQIPAAYCKGFARRYAQLLRIPAEVLEPALLPIACEQPPIKSVFTQAAPELTSSLRSFRVLTYLVGTIFIVLPLVWAYTHFAVRWSQNESLVDQTPVKSQTNSVVLGNNDSSENADAGRSGNLDHLQANMISAAMIQADADSSKTSAAHNAGTLMSSVLDINLSADSWISVIDADGNRLESNLRTGGQSYRYLGKTPFNVQIGRVSAAQVKLDGEKVDLQAFTIGDIANLEIGTQREE